MNNLIIFISILNEIVGCFLIVVGALLIFVGNEEDPYSIIKSVFVFLAGIFMCYFSYFYIGL